MSSAPVFLYLLKQSQNYVWLFEKWTAVSNEVRRSNFLEIWDLNSVSWLLKWTFSLKFILKEKKISLRDKISPRILLEKLLLFYELNKESENKNCLWTIKNNSWNLVMSSRLKRRKRLPTKCKPFETRTYGIFFPLLSWKERQYCWTNNSGILPLAFLFFFGSQGNFFICKKKRENVKFYLCCREIKPGIMLVFGRIIMWMCYLRTAKRKVY